jgi:hypothetical protein
VSERDAIERAAQVIDEYRAKIAVLIEEDATDARLTADMVADLLAKAIRALPPAEPEEPTPEMVGLRCTDPMERIIEAALIGAGISYVLPGDRREAGGALDFHLPDFDVDIEVKRMHSPRIADQMARRPNVIAAQGETAVKFLASALLAMRAARPAGGREGGA